MEMGIDNNNIDKSGLVTNRNEIDTNKIEGTKNIFIPYNKETNLVKIDIKISENPITSVNFQAPN
jgi:hypothetical protein